MLAIFGGYVPFGYHVCVRVKLEFSQYIRRKRRGIQQWPGVGYLDGAKCGVHIADTEGKLV